MPKVFLGKQMITLLTNLESAGLNPCGVLKTGKELMFQLRLFSLAECHCWSPLDELQH